VTEVLTHGVETFTRVFHHYEEPKLADVANDVKEDEGPRSPTRHIADLSFVARMELLGQSQRLVTLQTSEDPWLVLSECGSSRRSVLRSAVVVDRAICSHEGLVRDEVLESHEAELASGLRLRAAYAKLRRDLSSWRTPGLSEVVGRLRQANDRLGLFIESPLFFDARIDDRLQIRSLHDRVLRWLQGSDVRDARSGMRLWQDLTSAAALLAQVNLRSELLDHDRTLVNEVTDRLFGERRPTMVPEDVLKRLSGLYGRDDAVDGLLDSGAGQLAVEWQEPLERIRQNLIR
jgi:hypothetical protein